MRDCRIDVFRSGMVPQESAIRLTHLPTGTVAEGTTDCGRKTQLELKAELTAELGKLLSDGFACYFKPVEPVPVPEDAEGTLAPRRWQYRVC